MKQPMTPLLLETVAEHFRVLGDPTRLGMLQMLLEHGELNVGQFVDALGYSQANVSKHLRTLHDAGILERRAVGTSAFYSIADPSISMICDIVCDRVRERAAARAQQLAAL